MKSKRILSVLLACLMLLAFLAPTAMANDNGDNGWQKTTVEHRFFFSPWISNVFVGQLSGLADGLGVDLLGDIYTNAFVNDFMAEIIAAAGAFGNLASMRPFPLFNYGTADRSMIQNDLPPALRAHLDELVANGYLTANTTWAQLANVVDWGVTDRESLLATMPVVVRAFASLAFRDDIRNRWQSHYAPAFRALGIPEDQIATQTEIQAGWDAAQNLLTGADVLVLSVFVPVLNWAEALEGNLMETLLSSLPNMAYNADAITGLDETLVGSALLGFLEVDVSAGGFMAFFEGVLATEFYNMGIVMPEIDWDLVAHAGHLNEAGAVVADEQLMVLLVVRYLARAAAMPENRARGFQSLIGDVLPGFFSFMARPAAWAVRTLLGWTFVL